MSELEKIIEGCKSNKRVSQEKLYRQFYPCFHALCRQFFNDEQDIVTALNNGMLNIFKNIAFYDTAKGNFHSWCYTVVRNAAITYFRTKKTLNTVEITEALEYSFYENPFKEMDWEDLFGYLDTLPAATRAVSSLFYKEDFSIKEIAKELQISEGTVKWHLSECRKKLSAII